MYMEAASSSTGSQACGKSGERRKKNRKMSLSAVCAKNPSGLLFSIGRASSFAQNDTKSTISRNLSALCGFVLEPPGQAHRLSLCYGTAPSYLENRSWTCLSCMYPTVAKEQSFSRAAGKLYSNADRVFKSIVSTSSKNRWASRLCLVARPAPCEN